MYTSHAEIGSEKEETERLLCEIDKNIELKIQEIALLNGAKEQFDKLQELEDFMKRGYRLLIAAKYAK